MPAAAAAPADDLVALGNRVDRLEQTVAQSADDLRALRSEVATLVTLAADIRRRTATSVSVVPFKTPTTTPRTIRIASAAAGIVLGVSIGMWFWLASDSEPLLPSPPVAIASERSAPIAPQPKPAQVVTPPVTQPSTAPAVVPAATPARTVAARAAPRPAEYVGTLTIDSDPPGNVFIDRKPAGRTPLRAADLKAGSHLIWIEQDGYQRFTRVVQVPADRVTRLVADLERSQR